MLIPIRSYDVLLLFLPFSITLSAANWSLIPAHVYELALESEDVSLTYEQNY